MLVEFRSTEAGNDIHCNICIIGAGAAGITPAGSLIDSGIQACLHESGGRREYSLSDHGIYAADLDDTGVGAATG